MADESAADRNADRLGRDFLAAYNEIEHHLQSVSKLGEWRPAFMRLVREAERAGSINARQVDRLDAFSDLRNAISHGRYQNGKPIANPTAETVDEIQRLAGEIIKPARLADLPTRGVAVTAPTDRVLDVLAQVVEAGYSQFPVYGDGRYIGLLTTNAIARWLAQQMTENGGLAEDAPVAEVLRYAEPRDAGRVVSRSTRVADAIGLLSGDRAKAAVPALVVTATGQPHEPALLILTAEDLPELARASAH